jgi:hypothetical protein
MGYRTDEPNAIQDRERSELLSQVFSHLAQQGRSLLRISQELNVAEEHLEDLLFGLGATFHVDSRRKAVAEYPSPGRAQASARLRWRGGTGRPIDLPIAAMLGRNGSASFGRYALAPLCGPP